MPFRAARRPAPPFFFSAADTTLSAAEIYSDADPEETR
jgi:hypothetical protein